MSAFVLADVNFDYILSNIFCGASETLHLRGSNFNLSSRADVQALGQILLNENIKSVNSRYNESQTPHFYKFDYSARYFNYKNCKVQALSLLACYEYQASEHPGYSESDAAALVKMIRNRIIKQLPGYSDTEWCFSSKAEIVEAQEAEKKEIMEKIQNQLKV